MSLIINSQTCIVFDLDDTLYNEVEFLKSAYRHISKILLPHTNIDIYPRMFDLYKAGISTFDVIKKEFNFPYSIKELVKEYRYHLPRLSVSEEVLTVLKYAKEKAGKVGLLTDGRSITQRNKIAALNIGHYFDDVRVSEETGCEKPSRECFKFFQDKYPFLGHFIYVGDNIKKDFVAANELGWKTFGLRMNEWNIHKQDLNCDPIYHPSCWLDSLSELRAYL